MKKAIARKIAFALFATVALTATAFAEDAQTGWTPGFGLRLFGLDLDFSSTMPELLPIGKTELLAQFGGGLAGRGYYRNADGTRSADARGKLQSADADFWLRGTQYLDKASRFRAALFLRGETMGNLWNGANGATLLALSGLPDAPGFAELGAGAALGLTALDRKTSSGQEIGVRLDWCYEFSYDFYPMAMLSASTNEISLEFSGFLPLVDNEAISLVLAEHLLYSALVGGAPEHRLSRIGGNRFTPYPALGGLVRGVPDYSGDGRIKTGDNLDLRLEFPSLFKKVVIPGLTAFADAGIADDGKFGPDPGSLRLSAGALATLRAFGFVLGGGVAYEFMTRSFGPYVALGTQF